MAANQTPIAPRAQGTEAQSQIFVVILITQLPPLAAASCNMMDSNKYWCVRMKNYFYIQLNKGLADHQSSENLKLDNSSDWTQTISHFPGLTWTLFILIPSFKKVLNEENHS